MKRTLYTPSMIEKDDEEKLWANGIIVFDTCALLDFYYMTPDYQKIMAEILSYLSDRIWLPAQVVYEYNKNRDNAMMKPASEKYQDKDIRGNKFVDTLKKHIALWEKQYYHPYIEDTKLTEIKKSLAIIEPEMTKIKEMVAIEYQARKREIRDIKNNDHIADAIGRFAHGEPFRFSELKEIASEGAVRYANKIGPGYMDSESKIGIRQYGDLIIWKEILRYAKENQCDVIFLTNDVKGDWVIVDESKKDDRFESPIHDEIGHPRRDLLAEFEEETGQSVWFYKTTDFIDKLEERYQPKQAEMVFYGKLGQVRDVLDQIGRERETRKHYTGDSLLIHCDDCGELFSVDSGTFDFDWVGGVVDDRGMGYETEYEYEDSCFCPSCGKQIDLTFQVWEYPMGVFNYQNIEVDGGEIEEPLDLSNYISFEDYEICERCGERAVLNNIGLCERCEDEFNHYVNSDD